MAEQEPRAAIDRMLRWLPTVLVVVGLVWLTRYLSDVLIPFAAAVVLAYLLNPLVTVFEQKTHRRGTAVAITLAGLGIIGLAVVVIVVPLMASQAARFQTDLSKLRDDVAATFEERVPVGGVKPIAALPEDVDDGVTPKTTLGLRELSEGWAAFRSQSDRPRHERYKLILDRVEGTVVGRQIEALIRYTESDEFRDLLLGAAKQLAIGGWTVVAFAVNFVFGLTGLVIVLLYLIFLLLDYPQYAGTWKTFLPPAHRDSIVGFLAEFNAVLRRYFRGQAVVAISVGVLFAVGFSIIGLPMAIPFGLFVGLLNMVPYLQTVGLIPAIMLAALQAIEHDSSFALSLLAVLAVFAVAQVVQDALITPRVMGKATGLRPVAILLGLFVWGKLLGFLGLLLAIPLTCLIIAYYRRFVLDHGAEATNLTSDPV